MGTVPFISGVVEGFYGRPWNLVQRCDLISKLKTLSLSSYMYAPRDETKHRLNWRELYTPEEASSLQLLIDEANKCNVTFIYALCPQRDIDYNEKDKTQIIDKLTQVRSLGCTAFALLFHEQIPAEWNGEWQAEAQVKLTNAVYEQLGVKFFLIYPTVCTEEMAYPDLDRCAYLKIMGSGLNSNIQIMWSGTNTVSRVISVEHCQAVGQILKRKPFIWDNLFVNQYDRRLWGRLNLGPFSGRSVHLKDHISGLLLNPNNMYEANFIPFQTMSEWVRATADFDPDASIEQKIADELNLGVYDRRAALARAIDSWLPLFIYNIESVCEIRASAVDTHTDPVSNETSIHMASSTDLASNHAVDDFMEISPRPLTEAALGELVQLAQERALDTWDTAFATNIVPLNFDPPNDNEASYLCSVLHSSSGATSTRDNDDLMQVCAPRPLPAEAVEETVRSAVTREPGNPESMAINTLSRNAESADLAAAVVPVKTETNPITDTTPDTPSTEDNSLETPAAIDSLDRDKLELLIDFFHLPFEHGKSAISLLHNYRWILRKAPLLDDNRPEFATRVSDIKKTIDAYNRFFTWFMNGPRCFASELFPLVLEVHGLLSVVDGLVAWIEQGNLIGPTDVFQRAWPNEGDYFQGELWEKANPVQGIVVDLAQSIANSQETSELLHNPNMLPISLVLFQIRPLQRSDAGRLYHLVDKLQSQQREQTHIEMSIDDLRTYDRFFGIYSLDGYTKYAFLAEDTSTQVVGCAVVGCMSVSEMHDRISPAFIEKTAQRYIGDVEISDEIRNDIREGIAQWKPRSITEAVTKEFPSQVHIYAACDIADALATKRLVQTIASSLSYNGSIGMHVVVDPSDSRKIAFLSTLGFSLLCASNEEVVFGLTLSTEDYFD